MLGQSRSAYNQRATLHKTVRKRINDEPWFVGKDVAEALGYSKARNALATHVSDDDKKNAPFQGPLGGKQTMTIINESGLYSLILSSKLPNAKKFKRCGTQTHKKQLETTLMMKIEG